MADNDQHRSSSIPPIRLTQDLPPLPLNNLPPRSPSSLQTPYRDEPEDNDSRADLPPTEECPKYEPMHDYLRAQQRQSPPTMNPDVASCEGLSTTNSMCTTASFAASQEPYSDDQYSDGPFIVSINASQPPPAYNEIYQQHQQDMQRLMRQFDMAEMDEDASDTGEAICKWLFVMILIALTVAAVGLAFHISRG